VATPSPFSPNQSFIIYIIGSSYPANHPILRYPDMNLSEDASYEDLLRLASIIGPARPVTVTQEAIDAADLEVRTLNLSGKWRPEPAPPLKPGEDPMSDDNSIDEVFLCDPPKTEVVSKSKNDLKRKRRLSDEVTNPTPSKLVRTGLEGLMAVERCSICLTDWEDKDVIRVLRCQHGFHRDCVDHWLREGADRCPVCRMDAVKLTSSSSNSTTDNNDNNSHSNTTTTQSPPSVSST
jgi:hypothetical protein